MERQNLFDGVGFYPQFAVIIYKRLMSRKWVTYADVMAEHKNLKSISELDKMSLYHDYGELKKAFPDVCKAIKERVGADSIEEDGNNRNRRFRYVGDDDDPLSDMISAKTINDLHQYWQFCQDSAGFFPASWLEYFFKNTRDLLSIKTRKRRGEQIISSSMEHLLTNIELLPKLYNAIINHQVLSIDYKPYDEEGMTLIFHPHFLKEFNGRWHLFGHAEGREPDNGFNVALDRIIGEPKDLRGKNYISAPPYFYTNYFKDIVGVTHWGESEAKDIILRARSFYIFKLTETKKIHPSQETVVPFGTYDDGEYGEFKLHVEVNKELVGRILQMGEGLEVRGPEEVRRLFKDSVEKLAMTYAE